MSAVAKVPAVEAVAEAETAAAPAAVSPAAALEGEAAAAAAPSEPCGQEPTAKQPSSSDDSKKKKKSIQNGTTGRLLKACAQGKLEEAQAAVREGVRWGEAVTRNGAGPLHLAAFGGHLELIQWLADKCALPVSARDRFSIFSASFLCFRRAESQRDRFFYFGFSSGVIFLVVGGELVYKDTIEWRVFVGRARALSQGAADSPSTRRASTASSRW